MDETFMLFLNDIPAESQGFVLELDKYLTSKGSKRTIKAAKSGFVTSYASPVTGKALLNYVFRKTGVKMRIYAQSIGEHSVILSDLPENMTFFHSLTEENFDAIKKLIRSELGE